MKFFKIEIQVTFLTLIIAAVVIGSGYLVYQSLSQIVNSIHQEARPDFKLILIKDIASELTEAENTIRLYSLTNDESLTENYRELDSSIQNLLADLRDYAIPGSDEIATIDSIQLLTNEKLLILNRIQTLFKTRDNTNSNFSELLSRIDTTIVQSDTITFEQPEREGFFRRLFGRRDTTTREPIIIDNTAQVEALKQEIADIENQMTDRNASFQEMEKLLLNENFEVTNQINQHIAKLENSEQRQLETKTEEADFLAAQTYRRLALFTGASVFLLFIVLILFFRNLKKNRSYQKILQKAKHDAESLANAKERFVATVSHEMRTPVNAIFGLTEQMLQHEKDEETLDNLNVVHQSAKHLITLVNDTLDFSKIESQQMKIDALDFYPDLILNEIYTLHKQPSLAKGIQLVINNKTAKDLVLKGDPIRLKQILINLVTNAIKFTSKGYVIVNFEGEETDSKGFLLKMEVSDTGVGIPEKNIHSIFDEFVQLDNDQKFRGAGLGLAIVKKLVDLQGGEISVKSIPEKGSTFSIQIPYQLGNAENIKVKQDQPVIIPAWFKQLHFLLVDDEEFNLYMLSNILRKWGVKYTEAQNGKIAIEKAVTDNFDLILMDVRMPVIDGYEATRQILGTNPDAQIVALSATQNEDDIAKCHDAGMVDFLQKPFAESELFELVKRLVPEQEITEEETPEDILPEEQIIDLNGLEKMAGGDSNFVKEMLELFIKSSDNNMAIIHEGLKENDLMKISEAAHKLAAPAKHMMAMDLYNKLKTLENTARDGDDVDHIQTLISTIQLEVEKITGFIKKILDTKS